MTTHHDNTPPAGQLGEQENAPPAGPTEAQLRQQAEQIAAQQAEAARQYLAAQRQQRIARFQAALSALLDEHRMVLVPQVTISSKGTRADLMIEALD